MKQQQIVILKISYEDKNNPPSSWHWPTIIGCEDNCVEIMNYGAWKKFLKWPLDNGDICGTMVFLWDSITVMRHSVKV